MPFAQRPAPDFRKHDDGYSGQNPPSEAIITVDAAGKISRLNALAAELTGWRLQTAVGQPLSEVFRLEPPLRIEPFTTIQTLSLQNRLLLNALAPPLPISGSLLCLPSTESTSSAMVISFRPESTVTAHPAFGSDLYHHFFDSSPIPNSIQAPDGHFERVNQAFCNLFGYSCDELLALRFMDLTYPEDRPATQATYAGILQGEIDEINLEKRYLTRSGETLLARVTVVALRDQEGAVRHFLTQVLDITQQQALHQELIQNERKCRSLFENLLSGLACFRRDHSTSEATYHCLEANLAFQRLSGLKSVIGSRASEILADLHLPAALQETFHRVAMGAVPEQLEIYAAPRDTWYRLAVYCPEAEDFVVILDDITAQKRVAERIAASEDRLKLATLASGAGIWDLSMPSGRMIWDDAMHAMFGIERGQPEDLLMQAMARIHPDDLHALQTQVAGLLDLHRSAGAFDSTLSYRILTPSGDVRHLEAFVHIIPEAGEAFRIVGINRDVTARLLADEQLRLSRQELKAANRELAHSLTQVHDLALRAESANQAKSDFLASMSHELRTPLNGILGMSQLLLASALDSEQRRFAEIALQSGEAMQALIEDILDFSRIEARKLKLESKNFSLPELISRVDSLIASRAAAQNLTYTSVMQPQVPERLLGDPGRLRQILLNLLGNAVKFTEKGSVSLHVSNLSQSEGEVRLLFEIRDTGIGIRAEHKRQLFQPFTQGDASITRRFGGSGLGLAISRQLVELMSGRIGVESSPDQGSHFWFEVSFGIAVPPNNPSALVQTADQPHLPARVLVAEDNPVNQAVVEAMLRKLGCETTLAANGYEALTRLDESSFDLILMDCQMPELDGFSATREIRSRSRLQDLPIIAITAHALEGDRERCLAAGMNDYLTKPFTLAALGEVIKRWSSVLAC